MEAVVELTFISLGETPVFKTVVHASITAFGSAGWAATRHVRKSPEQHVAPTDWIGNGQKQSVAPITQIQNEERC